MHRKLYTLTKALNDAQICTFLCCSASVKINIQLSFFWLQMFNKYKNIHLVSFVMIK